MDPKKQHDQEEKTAFFNNNIISLQSGKLLTLHQNGK